MIEYHTFQTTVGIVKPLIMQRTVKDKNIVMHFHGRIYPILMRRAINKKRVMVSRPKFKNVLTKNGSGTSTD